MPAYLSTPDNPYIKSLVYEATSTYISLHETPHASSAVAAQEPHFPAEIAGSEHQSFHTKPYHAATLVEPRLEVGKPSV
jgi:hypothetical protein